MKWLTDRLKERTTWLAILGFIGLFGMKLEPELQDYIINGLIAAASIVAFLFRENERNVNIQLPPIEMQSHSEDDDVFRGIHSYNDLVEKGRPKPFHELQSKSELVSQDDGYISRDALRSGLRVDVPPEHITGTLHDERRKNGFENK